MRELVLTGPVTRPEVNYITLGFDERIRGSHHIFTRDGIEEILNLQPIGSKAKPYQVKQVRRVILTYRLAQVPDEE